MQRAIVIPALVGLLAAGGCQEKVPAEAEGEGEPTMQELSACEASCEAARACDDDVDPACEEHCGLELVNLREGISPECSAAYRDFHECDAELSCSDHGTYPNVCWEALDVAKEACAFDFCPDYCDMTAQCEPEQDREMCEDWCNGGAVLIAADAPDCLDDVVAAYECLSETTCADHGEQGPCGDLLAAVEDCKLTVIAERE